MTDDIPFKAPAELADRYAEEPAVESPVSGERVYWINSADDLKSLDRVLRIGQKITQRNGPDRVVDSPTGESFGAFGLPVR